MSKVKAILIALLSLVLVVSFISCDGNQKTPDDAVPTPTPAPEPEAKAPAKVVFATNMMADDPNLGYAIKGDFPTTVAMSGDSYIDKDGAIHGTFYLVDDSKFTAFWGEGKTEKRYYARYDLIVDGWKAATDSEKGNYLAYVKTSYSSATKTVEYGTYKGLDFCTILGSNADDIKKLKIEYYVVEGDKYERIRNTTVKPEGFDELIKGVEPITITIASDAKFEGQQPARIKFTANMMGSEYATETASGNVSSLSAMSQDTYIDSNGAIHGTFSLVDNAKFTAYAEGMTGKSYYANYEFNIDKLTATENGTNGTYLLYEKTSYNNGTKKTEYGTSTSRAKCTLIGSSAEDAKKLDIKYYVVTATAQNAYIKIYNQETKPENFDTLISGVTPIVITIADDAVFNK